MHAYHVQADILNLRAICQNKLPRKVGSHYNKELYRYISNFYKKRRGNQNKILSLPTQVQDPEIVEFLEWFEVRITIAHVSHLMDRQDGRGVGVSAPEHVHQVTYWAHHLPPAGNRHSITHVVSQPSRSTFIGCKKAMEKFSR